MFTMPTYLYMVVTVHNAYLSLHGCKCSQCLPISTWLWLFTMPTYLYMVVNVHIYLSLHGCKVVNVHNAYLSLHGCDCSQCLPGPACSWWRRCWNGCTQQTVQHSSAAGVHCERWCRCLKCPLVTWMCSGTQYSLCSRSWWFRQSSHCQH